MPAHALSFPALPLAAVSLLLACVDQESHVYRPELASVSVDGLLGARQPIPPEQPQGEVRVASFGVAEVFSGPDDAAIPVLHVRMVILNNGDSTAWQLDTREQAVVLPDEGRSGPLLVNGDSRVLPLLNVAPRERRTMALYFPLPATIESADQLPRFDYLWQVRTASRVVSERTIFQREELEEAAVTTVAGWGPWWWWFDTAVPGPSFVHPRVIVVRHEDHPPRLHVQRTHRSYVGRPAPPHN